MPAPKHNQDQAAKPVNQHAEDAYHHWLSEVERLCFRAFVPDDVLAMRAETKIQIRYKPLGMSWQVAATRTLNEEEKSLCEAEIARIRANRDVFAHRIGRESATAVWKSLPSDGSMAGGTAYRRRLREVGKVLAEMGGPVMPERSKKHDEPERDIDERQAAADRLAEELMR